MADALYDKYKESALSQNPSVDIDTDTIKITLVNTTTDYTFSAAHQYFNSVTDYLNVTPATLANKTVTDGTFDNTADITFSSVAIDGTKDVEALVIFKDTGTASTSPLIAYFDSFTAVTPNGGDITVSFNASGIFAL